MKMNIVEQLRPGDVVYWTDPDEDACSRYIRIAAIEIKDDIITLTDLEGDTLECYARELT